MQFEPRLHLAYFVTNAGQDAVEMEDLPTVPDQREEALLAPPETNCCPLAP